MEAKVPMVVAVGLWVASALAVTAYTYIAFKETANGLESGAMELASGSNPLVASAAVLTAEEVSPLEHGHFRRSAGH